MSVYVYAAFVVVVFFLRKSPFSRGTICVEGFIGSIVVRGVFVGGVRGRLEKERRWCGSVSVLRFVCLDSALGKRFCVIGS